MKLRRAIFALGAAFALSFGLLLVPNQAEAATVTINPRANAVEAGQILAAPDGSVFTITVYNGALATGQKSVTHTYQTGDTLRQTANKLVNKINADTELQGIGVTATLQNGANYVIVSTSTDGTIYKQTTTGGGSNRVAIQQKLTIGGTVTVDDKLTLTIYDAGLVGGKEAVVYKPNTGDTIADIVIRLRNKINNSTNLAALGITAKVSSADSSVLLIESPTFDATEKFTSYSAKVKAGGTETMTLGSFWGTNGAQTISVTGPVTVGETVKFTVFDLNLPDEQKTVSYVVQAGDNLNQIRCGLRTQLNNDSDLAAIGVHASCGGGVLDITSTSENFTGVDVIFYQCKPIQTNPTKWPAANQVKICGTASMANAEIARNTLELLGDSTQLPGGGGIEDAAQKLSSNSQLTWYLYADHDEYYASGHVPFFRQTGGPNRLSVMASDPLVSDGTLGLILGYSIGNGGAGFSAIFESSKDDKHTVGSGIQNTYIDHSVAHETGHHIDSWTGAKLSASSEFQTAWQRDMDLMAKSPKCKFEGPVENSTSVTIHPGVYSGAIDRKGDFICDSAPDGSGQSSSGYGGNSVDVMKAAYPYFGQTNLPSSEVFPELFAYLAGFDDTYKSNNNISGSASIETGNALACTREFVYSWSRHGRNPNAEELANSGYYEPDGTNTKFNACDGSVTTTPNSGA